MFHDMNGGGNLVNEVLDLRKSKRGLEDRVKFLELENLKISQGLNFIGNNEPIKPRFDKLDLKPSGITSPPPLTIVRHLRDNTLPATVFKIQPKKKRAWNTRELHALQQRRSQRAY